MARLVAVLTDFGYRDYYVAAMKGVIKTLCPAAEIVDVSHEVEKWSILDAAYILSCCYDDFPRGTVFLVVIDPGVGTERRAIAVKTRNYYLVGPDNGVLMPVAARDQPFEAREIANPAYKWWKSSSTFHGRDVFAPAAAKLACGASFEAVGPLIVPVPLREAQPIVTGESVMGRVMHVDWFGNVATNITLEELRRLGINYGDMVRIRWEGGVAAARFLPSFGYAGEGELLVEVNSCGRVEIAVNKGSAAERLGLRPGVEVILSRV